MMLLTFSFATLGMTDLELNAPTSPSYRVAQAIQLAGDFRLVTGVRKPTVRTYDADGNPLGERPANPAWVGSRFEEHDEFPWLKLPFPDKVDRYVRVDDVDSKLDGLPPKDCTKVATASPVRTTAVGNGAGSSCR